MKGCARILLFLLAVGCNSSEFTQFKNNLKGTWQIKNQDGTLFFEESWWIDQNQLFGKGERFNKGEINFKEYLSFQEIDDTLWYVVEGVNPLPTKFYVEKISAKEFIAVNTKNPFPKYIHYRIWKDSIVAKVYAETDTLRFNMLRVK